jgi:hypothetical protein
VQQKGQAAVPPVSKPALVKNATPTEIISTPVKMATTSSVALWGSAAGGVGAVIGGVQ